jgi:ketosteroid isomerase-like protein
MMVGMATPAELMTRIVERIFDRLAAFDFEGMRECLAPDIVLEWPYRGPGVPDAINGRDNVLVALGVTQQLFSSFAFSPTAFYPSPERQILVVEATSAGELRTGGSYSNRYVLVFAFNEGRIALWREYLDPRRTVIGPMAIGAGKR